MTKGGDRRQLRSAVAVAAVLFCSVSPHPETQNLLLVGPAFIPPTLTLLTWAVAVVVFVDALMAINEQQGHFINVHSTAPSFFFSSQLKI